MGKVDAQGPSITSVTALDIIAIMGSTPDSRCVGREGNECLSAEQICTNMYKMNCGCQTCYGKAV